MKLGHPVINGIDYRHNLSSSNWQEVLLLVDQVEAAKINGFYQNRKSYQENQQKKLGKIVDIASIIRVVKK